jgi:hypothetical protein
MVVDGPGRGGGRGTVRRSVRLRKAGGVAALAAVLGPGLRAGLSDDDPAGITTYSILGADHGYQLQWVLAVATVVLVLFHDLEQEALRGARGDDTPAVDNRLHIHRHA